jgi:ribosomal-protein-alanine N-acetyltransferase
MADSVSLRPITISDSDFLVELTNEPEYRKYYLDRLIFQSKKEALDAVNHYLALENKDLAWYFIIEYKKNKKSPQERVGFVDLYNISKVDKRASIGYGLDKKFWGKGIATRAGKLALKKLSERNFHSCEATTHPKNKGSRKVLEKLGFKKIGILKDYYFENNKFIPRVLYWKILKK